MLRSPTTRAQPGPAFADAASAVGRRSLIGRVLEHVPDTGARPVRLPFRRQNSLLVQPPTNLLNAQALVADPAKNLLHHPRLLRDRFVTGHALAFDLAEVAITVRSETQSADFTALGRVTFATSAALQDLGALVLGEDSLKLQQHAFL